MPEKSNTEIIRNIFASQFDCVGFAHPTLPEEYVRQYKKWLDEGFHGDLTYMERTIDRRLAPEIVLPGVKTVIVVALNYYPGDHAECGNYSDKKTVHLAKPGKVSRYAWGDDYHGVFEEKFAECLAECHKIVPEASFKPYVDYGPVLERAYAEQAGIGFIGKNGLIITKEFGSWVLLGVILTDLQLQPDSPANRMCGSCTRCLDACPTQALVAEGLVDARRCISYQTIENKTDSIPDEIAQKSGNWVFGCDTCQEVCPHNCRAKLTQEPAFQKKTVENGQLDGDTLQEMDEPTFKIHYKDSPLKRAKLSGLRRNIEAIRKHN